MRKRKLAVVVLVCSMMLALVGCGASSDSAATESMNMSATTMNQESAAMDTVFYDKGVMEEATGESVNTSATESGSTSAADEAAVQTERKLIKTVDMTVETKEFDQTLLVLENKIAELGGYIETLDTYNGSSYSGYRSSRDANMTIRIPKQSLDTFLETVEGVSNVVRRSESVEDITLTYVDLESHKKVLLAEQDTLLELMKQAEAIEDIITIESRLSEVRYQLESMESQLRTFDNKVDYSTVYLYVEEVRELTPVVEETVWQRITGGFKESLQDIGDSIVEFAIWFVVNIPYFILWIAVLAITIVVIKLVVKMLNKANAKDKARKAKIADADHGSVEQKP